MDPTISAGSSNTESYDRFLTSKNELRSNILYAISISDIFR
jgi:hypothetical protein